MADEPVRTKVRTDDGWLDFQEYFVHRRQTPEVHEIRFDGIGAAQPTSRVVSAIDAAELVLIGPSNPFASIGPILALPGMRDRIMAARSRGVPVIAVSPIVGGVALKGPAGRMMASLGHESSAVGVAALYADLLTGFVLDAVDASLEPALRALGMRTHVTDTIMADDAGRSRLARTIMEFGGTS
jgi:LPPG:FO 2-phospho-L-lactate transferase